ncbi:phytanoyl-CoA dioxygenase family protein [uncultured Massilia sp.]|uniref:phytanoyl-CoA dioxygenase family protein n=1 Tax=uncultured Massilia sp. TaxID=169973 RepID=UPI0025F89464|nr:phytanoyl-CoA dioxygenase family protein [uncultured Massilia sp.]
MQEYVTAGGRSRHARLRLMGYYVQRAVTSRRVRRLAARIAVAVLAALHGRPARACGATPGLDALRADGVARLGRLLSARQCAEALDWLRGRHMRATRGDGRAFRLDAAPPGTPFGDFPLDTVVHCPHVLALANHPDVLRLAADYLGYTPTITLMGLRWSFPAAAPDGVQAFHRDAEPGSIKLLVYLTDVDEHAGPHHYVAGSHRARMPLRLRRHTDAEVARDHGGAVLVTGPAGSACMIDTRGIHKGAPPARRPRLLLVVQYSLLPCLLYDYAPVHWRGDGHVDPYVNRLVVAPRPPLSAW